MSVSSTELGASPARSLDSSGSSCPQGEHIEPTSNKWSTLLHPYCLLSHENEPWWEGLVQLSLIFDCGPCEASPNHTSPLRTSLGNALPLGKPSACPCTSWWLFHSGRPSLLWALNLPIFHPARAHILFHSVFQGPNPHRFLFLFPLTLEACIMVAQNKHVRAKPNMRDELGLPTSSVCLGEKCRKNCFRNIVGVLSVHFVSFLTCFCEGNRRENDSFHCWQEACTLEGRVMEESATSAVPTTQAWAGPGPRLRLFSFLFFLSRVFPNSPGPVPACPHLRNGNV